MVTIVGCDRLIFECSVDSSIDLNWWEHASSAHSFRNKCICQNERKKDRFGDWKHFCLACAEGVRMDKELVQITNMLKKRGEFEEQKKYVLLSNLQGCK